MTTTTATACTHHYVAAAPDGPVAVVRCRRCGHTGTRPNHWLNNDPEAIRLYAQRAAIATRASAKVRKQGG